LTDGERWTAEALAELRRRRYRPVAWVAFLRSSLERSSEDRRERRRMAWQARAWGVAGALAWVSSCAATRGRDDLRLRPLPGLVWWLAVWRMLDWHLGMAEGGDGHRRERLSSADAITLTRFWLVPAVCGTARSGRALPTVIVLGGVTDWLDGCVALRQGRTRLGRDLDTTADLAFLTTVAIAARATGRLTPLGFAVLITRHVLGVAVALTAVFGRARRPAIRARPWGALLRIGGLAIGSIGARRSGTVLLVLGSIVPPRSTAAHLSPV
jgi:phosphatidylglycerophosphate synthase